MKLLSFLTLLIPLGMAAQTTVPLPVNQPSYSLLYFNGLSPASEHATGVAFEAELRRSRHFSWIVAAGQDWERSKVSWGTVPVSYPGQNPDDPTRTLLVDFDDIEQTYARLYLGAGPQYNQRIGNGDLSGSAVLHWGLGQLTQRLTYERQQIFPYQDASGNQAEKVNRDLVNIRIKYYELVQPGLRLQLHYTWWFGPQFALRAGGYFLGYGGVALNKYEKSAPVRHRPRTAYRDPDRHSGSRGSGFPDKSFYRSRSPEALQLRTGLSVGLVYKPLKQL